MRDGTDYETQLGRYLRECRISQQWLADQIGGSASRISRWCNGAQPMPLEVRDRIMEALECEADRLIALLRVPLELLDDQDEPRYKRTGVR